MSSLDVCVPRLSLIDRISSWLAEAPGQINNETEDDDQAAFTPSSYEAGLNLSPTQSPLNAEYSPYAEVRPTDHITRVEVISQSTDLCYHRIHQRKHPKAFVARHRIISPTPRHAVPPTFRSNRAMSYSFKKPLRLVHCPPSRSYRL